MYNKNKIKEKTLILTKCDLERLEKQLNLKNVALENARKQLEERQRLHDLSVQRVKNWTNTIMGQRQKNLEARKIREENEENERKLMDADEARYQAQQRKLAIEKAKKQQFFHSDKVKRFHSALLLTEVLKERENQIELKRNIDSYVQQQENDEVLKMQSDYENYLENEKNKLSEQRQKNKEISEAQKLQMQMKLKKLEDEKEKLKKEAENLDEQKDQFNRERKEIEDMKKLGSIQQKNENLKQIQLNKDKLVKETEQDESENERVRQFALMKRKVMKTRTEKEIQIRRDKQENLEKLIKQMTSHQIVEQEDENEKIGKALEEEERKHQLRKKEEKERQNHIKESIEQHRIETEKLKLKEQLKKKEEEIEFLNQENKNDELKLQNEIKVKQMQQDKAKKLNKFHKFQMSERLTLEKIKHAQEQEQAKRNLKFNIEEEENFQKYASAVIDDREKRGRNTNLLRKVAAKECTFINFNDSDVRKINENHVYKSSDLKGNVLPKFQRYTTDETKRIQEGNIAGDKKLGLAW